MKVLGIVATPRGRRGLTYEMVEHVLAGCRAEGAETDLLNLIDHEPRYCIHCAHACFQDGRCVQEDGATERSLRVNGADALVLGTPVYCWQPTGLMASFFDKYRPAAGGAGCYPGNGRPAVGVAVAGNSGTGVFAALRAVYAWMNAWRFRPIEPISVTKFNHDRAVMKARALGGILAKTERRGYSDAWECMLEYDRLPLMRLGRVDEFRWLAMEGLATMRAERRNGDLADEIERVLALSGRPGEVPDEPAARACMEAYGLAARAWQGSSWHWYDPQPLGNSVPRG